jgi:cytochrome c-type biogenesis protein CcmF
VGGALILFALRANSLQAKGVFSLVSRESSLVANNILLVVSAFVVFVGTIWPYIAEIFFDRKLSVGPPFFNIAFTPFMVALGLILPIGAMVPWKRGRLNKILRSLIIPVSFALLLACFVWAVQSQKTILGPMGIFLGMWIVLGALYDLYTRTGSSRNLLRLISLPRSDWGKTVAHVGFGTTLFAISALVAWESEDIRTANVGETWSFSGYDFTLVSVENSSGPNYFSTQASIKVAQNGELITTLFPEKRNYPIAQMPTTEAAINYKLTRDVYLVLGDRQIDGKWTVRTYIKPFANWIWAGCLIMALGALISLSDRRYRVAAGAQSRSRVELEKA